MPAPEVSAFGDGSHAPGASGLTINGGGFGAFPGSAWIFENDDRSGDADELTVNDWNDIALDVDIPASLNNAAGTRYLRVQREDLAWSNALAFTLESGVVTLMPAGRRTTAAHPAIASERKPPSGKPNRTFSRDCARSFTFHFSSTAPEEKKKTSYGVMAAPKRAMA